MKVLLDYFVTSSAAITKGCNQISNFRILVSTFYDQQLCLLYIAFKMARRYFPGHLVGGYWVVGWIK